MTETNGADLSSDLTHAPRVTVETSGPMAFRRLRFRDATPTSVAGFVATPGPYENAVGRVLEGIPYSAASHEVDAWATSADGLEMAKVLEASGRLVSRVALKAIDIAAWDVLVPSLRVVVAGMHEPADEIPGTEGRVPAMLLSDAIGRWGLAALQAQRREWGENWCRQFHEETEKALAILDADIRRQAASILRLTLGATWEEATR